MLLFDEFSAGNPNSLMALQMAATNRFVGFPNGEVVFKHPQCYMIAADNVNGAGGNEKFSARNKLDGATRNRLAILEWNTDWDLMEWVVTQQGGDTVWVKKAAAINRILEKRKIEFSFTGRDALAGAQWLKAGFSEDEVLQAFLWEHISPAEQEQVKAEIVPPTPLVKGKFS